MAGAVKVKEINLERGNPTVEEALRRMVNGLTTAKGSGYRAVILIHGYGSSGTGGAIRTAVRSGLSDRSLTGVVRDSVPGEHWQEKKKAFTDVCGQLRDFDRTVSGNRGLTVVLLR